MKVWLSWQAAKSRFARKWMCLRYAHRKYGTPYVVLNTDWATAEAFVADGIDTSAMLDLPTKERDRVPLAFFGLLSDIYGRER